jgi:hypothetical protein
MLLHVRHHWWNQVERMLRIVELNDSLVNRRLEWWGTSFAILEMPRTGQRGLYRKLL